MEQSFTEMFAGEARRITEFDTAVTEQAAQAPRVVNANFADIGESGRVLEQTEPLIAGNAYDLLVDVGPRWQSITSIVRGNSVFSEKAIPLDQGGVEVQAVVVSDQFEPRVQAAMMWVPARTGRSFPIIDGVRAKTAGPVKLRLTAPKQLPQDQQLDILRLRFCLYYGNNLLQSGTLISVGGSFGGNGIQ
jgi:hypothetical protein